MFIEFIEPDLYNKYTTLYPTKRCCVQTFSDPQRKRYIMKTQQNFRFSNTKETKETQLCTS